MSGLTAFRTGCVLLFSAACWLEAREIAVLDPEWTSPRASEHREDVRNRNICGGFVRSGRLDLNQRPFGPQPNALPDCATPRGDAGVDDSPGSEGKVGNEIEPELAAAATLRSAPH
jgi:hypothetical protein